MVSVNNSEVNEWKDAVIDACVINCIGWDENDPRKTIRDLCHWEADIALDPKVSSDAQKLVDDTVENCARMVEIYASLWSNLPPDQSKQLAGFFARNLREQKGKSWDWIRRTYESIHADAEKSVSNT